MRLERWWNTVPLRLRSLFRSRDVERELDDELHFHVEREIDEHVARGMTPEQARTIVLRALGGLEQRKEECRDTRRVRVIENILRDAHYALRTLRSSPGFTVAAILSLALGIGSNTAIFSLINALSLRTLPVTAPDRLVVVSGGGSPNKLWTYAIWDQVRQHSQSFAGACAWGAPGPSAFRFNLVRSGEMRPIDGIFASGSYFTTLGVPAVLGRTFSERDDTRGGGPGGPVALISYAFWQRHFGGAASAVGERLRVNDVWFTIVGVTPPEFFGPEVGRAIDITVPLATEPLLRGRDSYLDHEAAYWLNVMLRVEPGQSLEAASAALRTVQPRIREGAMPSRGREQFLQKPLTLTSAAAGTSGLRQRYERPLLAVFVVVMLVLLIACANIANLLLARAAARKHELTVRLALGAGRWRLAQQLFVESFVLSLAGAAIGLVFAIWGSRALVAFLTPDGNPVFLELAIDGRVLLFTMLVAFATTLLFGTAPALHAAAVKPIDALNEQGRGPAAAMRAGVSSAVVVVQVALSIVLVVAAGLFLRTFTRLLDVSPGFDADRVLIVNVNVGRSHTDIQKRLDLFQRLADSAAATPRVARAAASATTPLSRSTWGGAPIEVRGAPPMAEQERRPLVNFVSPGWFATYGTPLIAGRDVDERDTGRAPFVAVVNEAFARKFFGGRDALGGIITHVPDRSTRSIVGIVRDAVYTSPREPAPPTIYIPLRQYDWNNPFASVSISVKAVSGTTPVDLARSVGAALTEVDGDLAFTFRSLEDQVNASVAQERLLATLASVFGALALLLAGVGLYGITSYAVNRRRAELGIRMALGAAPRGIVGLVLTRVIVLVALGVAIGIAASLWASRFVATLLYGLDPRDPTTLAGATLVLTAIAAAAAWLPAWRASRIDPAHVLRDT